MCQVDRKRIAIVIAANATGGHEFQSRALADDFAGFASTTIFLNRLQHGTLFEGYDGPVVVREGLFLDSGWLGKQVLNGLRQRREILGLLKDYDHVIICAGTVEAGVCTSLALFRKRNTSLYLPFFYDRTTLWGRIGCLYNLILGRFGVFYRNIITINRIQARLIRSFMHRPTVVVPNLVRDVPRAERRNPGRILCISRLDRQKRIPELLRWLDFEDNPYKEVFVIGDGPDRDAILKTVRQLLHMKVSLLGWKSPSEQDELIDGNDVLILNSRIEGEPLVICEAYKRGLPVLVRDIPGVRGVTTRSNRFSNQFELRKALLCPLSSLTVRSSSANTRTLGVRRLMAQIVKLS